MRKLYPSGLYRYSLEPTALWRRIIFGIITPIMQSRNLRNHYSRKRRK